MTVKNLTAQPCSDDAIIQMVKMNTDKSTYEAWKCLTLHSTPMLRGKLRKLGVRDDNQMADLENEALAALFQNILRGSFRGESAVSTYLVRIGMNRWFKSIRGSRAGSGQVADASTLGLMGQVEAYLDKKLNEADRKAFEQQLGSDPDLQEILAAAKEARPKGGFRELNTDDAERLPDAPPDTTEEEMIELVEATFPAGSTCRHTLIDYYFVHAANYEDMVKATMRPREEYETVYSRLRRAVARCREQLKETLFKK